MELKINEVQLPEPITFNYEELKKELTEKVSLYENLFYADEQIKEAKADKANLNKLKKALNDERIRREREYMEPFNDFKAKINEIISIIDKPVAVIDKQVKAFEEKQKQDKHEKIKGYWMELLQADKVPEAMTLDKIFDPKWLNASVSMKSIQETIDASLTKIAEDLATLENLPEFGFEATEVYKTTLDLNKALNEGRRLSEIAKRKAEYEAEQARLAAEAEAKKQEEQLPGQMEFHDAESFERCVNPQMDELPFNVERSNDVVENPTIAKTQEPQKQLVKFAAYLSVEDAEALKAFFLSRQIEFRAI